MWYLHDVDQIIVAQHLCESSRNLMLSINDLFLPIFLYVACNKSTEVYTVNMYAQ